MFSSRCLPISVFGTSILNQNSRFLGPDVQCHNVKKKNIVLYSVFIFRFWTERSIWEWPIERGKCLKYYCMISLLICFMSYYYFSVIENNDRTNKKYRYIKLYSWRFSMIAVFKNDMNSSLNLSARIFHTRWINRNRQQLTLSRMKFPGCNHNIYFVFK